MTKPLVTNAADAKQVENAKSLAELRHERRLSDFRWVASDRRGRRFLRELIEFCELFKTTFTGGSETFLREGRRQVGLRLWADLSEAAPETFPVMMQEQREDG